MVVNDRIKLLAELSKRHKTILVDGLMQSVLLIDPEKFAELIVNECCQMMIDMETKYPANLTVREIKKHFGV
jgi:hypothetical protein